MAAAVRAVHAAADTLLPGRVTYESLSAAWSHQTGELAEQINGIPLALIALSEHPYGETDVAGSRSRPVLQ
ncbi:hypothetical protein [Microtetraspora malaysiensis]|uniref:hypothetical protein n=1 Tax=Microtetraspora malaysiensis TaxID=161358 RepID=UPI003D8D9DD4